MNTSIKNISQNEYDSYTAYYIDLAPDGSLYDVMERQSKATIRFFESIPSDLHGYRYADNKWSIKEVFQHLMDTERIFAYRALRFSRADQSELPGFEVDDYVKSSMAGDRKFSQMIKEFQSLKEANS